MHCDCVVLISGGADSAACVDFYKRQVLIPEIKDGVAKVYFCEAKKGSG